MRKLALIMAPWTVKTPEGSLDFPSLADVERAYRMGLVGPEDELRERGRDGWRKASSHPALRNAAAPGHRQHPLLISSALAVLLALAALLLLVAGYWIAGLVLAFVLAAFLLRMSRRAFPPPRRTLTRGRA